MCDHHLPYHPASLASLRRQYDSPYAHRYFSLLTYHRRYGMAHHFSAAVVIGFSLKRFHFAFPLSAGGITCVLQQSVVLQAGFRLPLAAFKTLDVWAGCRCAHEGAIISFRFEGRLAPVMPK